jgi:hypothetical protein
MNKNIILLLCAILLISFAIAQPISKRNANEIELSNDEEGVDEVENNDVVSNAEEEDVNVNQQLEDEADSNDEDEEESEVVGVPPVQEEETEPKRVC